YRSGRRSCAWTAVKSGSIRRAVQPQDRRMSDVIHDTLRRPLASLRLSVTDRCNLRCRYCMPEDEYAWLPRTSILTFEEIERLTHVFSGLGVHKVRLTGGEPLLRHDLSTLVAMIARNPRIRDLAITTNGLLLGKQAAELRTAGLQRVTVSLDTLRPERIDRKSTRLNSSHDQISYAVFCLKKKIKNITKRFA